MKRWLREKLRWLEHEATCWLFGCDSELKCWTGRLASGVVVRMLYMECNRCQRRWSLDD